MSKAKRLVLSAVAAATLLTSMSQAVAGCVFAQDRGSPHADGGGWTTHLQTQHAWNTWQDWFWRMSWESPLYQCPWGNAQPTCPITSNFTKAVSHSKEWGFSVGPGADSKDWFQKAMGSLAFNFHYTQQRTWTDSFSFIPGGSILRGQKVDAITVQDRRWRKGVFKGGWVQTSQSSNYRYPGQITRCYDFDWGRTFGEWSTNTAEGRSYHTYHIFW